MIAFAFLQHRRIKKARAEKKHQWTAASTKLAGRPSRHRQAHRSTAAASDARTAENGSAQTCSTNRSAKVVLIDRFEVVDGTLKPVAQIDLGFPAEFRPRQGNVRLPLFRIVGRQRLKRRLRPLAGHGNDE